MVRTVEIKPRKFTNNGTNSIHHVVSVTVVSADENGQIKHNIDTPGCQVWYLAWIWMWDNRCHPILITDTESWYPLVMFGSYGHIRIPKPGTPAETEASLRILDKMDHEMILKAIDEYQSEFA